MLISNFTGEHECIRTKNCLKIIRKKKIIFSDSSWKLNRNKNHINDYTLWMNNQSTPVIVVLLSLFLPFGLRKWNRRAYLLLRFYLNIFTNTMNITIMDVNLLNVIFNDWKDLSAISNFLIIIYIELTWKYSWPEAKNNTNW